MTGPRNQDRRACQPSSPTRAVLARALQAVSAREKAEDPPGPLPRSSSLLGDPLPSSFHCTGLGKVTWAKAHSKVLHPGELRTVFTSGLFPPAIWGRFLSVWKVKFPLLPCHLGLIGT